MLNSYGKEANAAKKSCILSLMILFWWSQSDPKFWAARKRKIVEDNLLKSGLKLAEA